MNRNPLLLPKAIDTKEEDGGKRGKQSTIKAKVVE